MSSPYECTNVPRAMKVVVEAFTSFIQNCELPIYDMLTHKGISYDNIPLEVNHFLILFLNMSNRSLETIDMSL